MSEFIPWNSQRLEDWAGKYASGKFINLNGRKTHYIEKGKGKPLILLHGFFYDSYLWAENINVLAEKFKIYALDLWGFGYSTRDNLDYDYQLYVEQVLLFMDSLNISRASFIGQSMGGGTTILFAVQHRERVNKLLLVAPSGLPNSLPLTAQFFKLPRIGEFFLGLRNNIIRRKNLRDFWIYNKELLNESYFENVTRFHKIHNTNEVLLKILRKQFFGRLRDEINCLALMEVPILLVWGRKDKAIPLCRGKQMQDILKGSRLEVIENAGHVPNFEGAEEFNRLAIDFLGE
ncbi:MAG: alpha/beta hydrolase [Xenococcaceae cyanobacterium MO_188.B19]|nr:alpha/beta hydrolase [Xenococcaceae cyanobacterium MO_188.B19]